MKKILTIAIVFLMVFVSTPVKAADACYQCNGQSNIYKWSTNGGADSACASGYHGTNLSKDECVSKGASIIEAACYACGSTNGVNYKWSTSNPSSYRCSKVNKTESECTGGEHYVSSSIKTVECAGISDIPAALPKFISNIVNLIKIATPIILIIMGMSDFLKSMMANDDKGMNDGKTKFIKRLISGVIVFVVVSIVQLVFSAIQSDDINSAAACINCFINGECSGLTFTQSNVKTYSCTDIKSEDDCYGFDTNGNVCAWYNNACIRAKDKPDNSGCREYKTKLECPEVHVDVRCEWSDEESWCTYAGKALTCEDYNTTGSCNGKTDDQGNTCKWESGKCIIDNKENCSDYDADGISPLYTGEGKICNLVDNKCTEITYSVCSNYLTEESCPSMINGTLCEWNNALKSCIQVGKAGNCSKWISEEDCETFEDDYGNACYWEYGVGCKNA